MAINAENVPIWRRLHDEKTLKMLCCVLSCYGYVYIISCLWIHTMGLLKSFGIGSLAFWQLAFSVSGNGLVSPDNKPLPKAVLAIAWMSRWSWWPVTLSCAWTNGWINHRDAGELRRHWAHYDATLMNSENLRVYDYCGVLYLYIINSLAPGRSWCDFKNVIFNLALLIGISKPSYDNILRWMPQALTGDKSTVVRQQAITWTSVEQDLQRQMASLGPNELITEYYVCFYQLTCDKIRSDTFDKPRAREKGARISCTLTH